MEKAVLALDLGASSGRAVIGKYKSGAFELTEIHRFYHKPIMKENTLYWDIDFIFSEIKKAIKLATSTTKIDSLAIDTWGVDYGLLDDAGFLIEAPTHYRDKKTEGIIPKITKLIPEEELYQITGIQLMEINTLFQLKADELNALEKFSKAKTMLLISDLLNYLLTGKKKTEMSIASTTGLLDPVTKNWNEELISRLKIPRELFTDIASEGQSLGFIKEELDLPPILVYHVCAHDTASAFASSASLEDCLFVSCGTWSLIGMERVAPIINEKSKKYNLTNESGIDRTTRLLKNTTGLWIIQELKREFNEAGKNYTYVDFESMMTNIPEFTGFIDTEDLMFSSPGNMNEKIKNFLKKTDQSVPETDGGLIRVVYESLAFKFRTIFLEIMDTTNIEFSSVKMVGGGIQSQLLCEMIANASGLTVFTGPTEATVFGNIAVQLKALGCFSSLTDMRSWIQSYAEIKTYLPQNQKMWEVQFERYKEIIK